MSDAKIVEQAKQRFKIAAGAEKDQRAREQAVLNFDAGDQWTDEMKAPRQGGMVNGVPVPGRPMLTIPKTNQPVKLIVNQQQRAHLGVQVHAESEDATDDTAEILQGLYRHIEQGSRAHIARNWAFKHAVKMGRGFWRVNKRSAKDGGLEYGDQDITIERILNQASVYLDPFATEPDWSDGEWAFIGGWVPWDRFKREYPKSDLVKAVAGPDGSDDEEWEGVGDDAPQWFDSTDDGKAVRVMEYFVVETKIYRRCAYKIRGKQVIGWKKEAPPDAKDQTIAPEGLPEKSIVREWDIERRSVKWYKVNGIEVLDEGEWDGQYIPIVVVLAEEKNINGKRKFEGIIEPCMDSGRLFNVSASSMLEKNSLTNKAPWVLAEGQEEGHEDEFAQANIRNFAFIRYKPVKIGDHVLERPARDFGQVDLSNELVMLEQADQFIKSVTAVHDPSLGDDKKTRTGKAVLALQQQSQDSNSDYLDNFASVSMTHEARMVLDLIPAIYDRPGRIARTLNLEDQAERVMLNAPFVVDPRTKRPMPANETDPGVKQYDLKRGIYGVQVTVGKSHQTKAQQGADEVGQILQGVPQLMPIIGDIYFNYRDFPGAKQIAERIKKMLPPQLQEQEGGKPSPEQLEQQLAQAGQQFQQLQAQLQQAMQDIATDKAKQEANVLMNRDKLTVQTELEKIKLTADIEKERIAAQAKIAVEQIKAGIAQARAEFDAEIQNEQMAAEQTHESVEAERSRQHEAQEGDKGREHETNLTVYGTEQERQQADAERQHEAIMAERGHSQGMEATREQMDREDQRADKDRKAKANEKSN
jgi:hypothetical protein